MFCLEESVNKDNVVRLIDLFVESLPLEEYGFVQEKKNPLGGRPAYHPSDWALGLCPFAGKEQTTNERTLWNISTTAGHRGTSIWNDKKTVPVLSLSK